MTRPGHSATLSEDGQTVTLFAVNSTTDPQTRTFDLTRRPRSTKTSKSTRLPTRWEPASATRPTTGVSPTVSAQKILRAGLAVRRSPIGSLPCR